MKSFLMVFATVQLLGVSCGTANQTSILKEEKSQPKKTDPSVGEDIDAGLLSFSFKKPNDDDYLTDTKVPGNDAQGGWYDEGDLKLISSAYKSQLVKKLVSDGLSPLRVIAPEFGGNRMEGFVFGNEATFSDRMKKLFDNYGSVRIKKSNFSGPKGAGSLFLAKVEIDLKKDFVNLHKTDLTLLNSAYDSKLATFLRGGGLNICDVDSDTHFTGVWELKNDVHGVFPENYLEQLMELPNIKNAFYSDPM